MDKISRRKFFQKATLTALLLGVEIPPVLSTSKEVDPFERIIKPKRLSPGDTIGLISPSGAIYESEPYDIARDVFEKMGLKVKFSDHLKDRYGHLGGSDDARAKEVNDMFTDKSVNAIMCIRGGSGAARIVDKLDYKAIAGNPKIFIGYSDITALLLAIYAKTGLVTFHGPVGISEWNEYSYDYFRQILFDGEVPLLSNPGKDDEELIQTENRIRTINPGMASGILAGGNLSVLTGLVGTGYLPDWKGKILFLEEVGEKIHVVDRLMSQLKLAGILDQLSGFVLGKCTRCEADSGYGSLTLEEVIDHYIKPLSIPAYSGAMIGHIAKKFTVPIGVEAQINANKGTIQLSESAVI